MTDARSLEEPLCPMCRSPQQTTVATRTSWAPYRVVRCDECRFHFLSPRPTEATMRGLYTEDSYFEAEGPETVAPVQGGYGTYATQEHALRLTFRRWLTTLARAGHTGGSLLEVGCGNGYLLAEAAPFFDRRDGTELSAAAATEARKYADHVHHGSLDDLSGDTRYDVVLSNQVIEHVYDPEGFVHKQLERLRPGGSLVVATPWMSSPWQRILGSHWPSFKVPEHVLYFDRTHLAHLLRRAGLEEVTALPYLHAFPLALVGAKLRVSVPRRVGGLSIWIPGTTLGMAARRPRG